MLDGSLESGRNVSLVEVVDRVLNKGAVISGELAISVADIELIKLSLKLVIASSGTLLEGINLGEEIMLIGEHEHGVDAGK